MKKQVLMLFVILFLYLPAERGVLAQSMANAYIQDIPGIGLDWERRGQNRLRADVCPSGQEGDPDFSTTVEYPVYPPGGNGPLVVIDEAHYNFHTIECRYKPLANLLTNDGYTVKGSTTIYEKFDKAQLQNAGVKILIVANALAKSNFEGEWKLPIPSAFAPDEITELEEWVYEGGSLMLIADHFPFPGAAQKLANEFGFTMVNGYTIANPADNDIEFSKDVLASDSSSLTQNPITYGRQGFNEEVPFVYSFTGSVFSPILSHPYGMRNLMILGPNIHTALFSNEDELLSFNGIENVPHVLSWYRLQGATLIHGKGRLAIFGEASMFTAQLCLKAPCERGCTIPCKTGMNSPKAPYNKQFALNVVHWLDRVIDDDSVASEDCVEIGQSQPVEIDKNLNVHIPCATFHGQDRDMNVTIDLEHAPDDGKFLRFDADYTILE